MDMNQVDFSSLTEEERNEITNDVVNVIQDDEYKVEIDYELTNTMVEYIVSHYDEIKTVISDSLTNWTIDRLSYVDRAILFSATSEMKLNIAPKQVIINEYLDITPCEFFNFNSENPRETDILYSELYSMVIDEKQVKFNNRVLDVIASKVYE